MVGLMRHFVILLTAVLFILTQSSCGSSPELDRVQRTGAAAQARPGAKQVAAYAQALHSAHLSKAYKKNPAEFTRRVEEALAMLDSAAESQPQAAPTLVAWKGLLFIDIDRLEEGWAAFNQSMKLKPNMLAAQNLVQIYGVANKPTKVGEICARTTRHISAPDERYQFIKHCMENTNALDENGALSWASRADRAFFQAERQRRRNEAAASAQAAAEREAYEQRVVRQMEICAGRCKERGHLCMNDCYNDERCEKNCIEANHSCVAQCESRAYKALER